MNSSFRKLFSYLLLGLVLTEVDIYAQNEVQVGRYSSIRALPTEDQVDVFKTIVRVEFPESVKKVGTALERLLREQGYQLSKPRDTDDSLRTLLNHPLPRVHQKLGPMSLKHALETLSGPVWTLVHDPVNRIVGFELCTDAVKDEQPNR